jgi:hypothetical protein
MIEYATCDVANIDPSSGACSAIVWTNVPTALPPLSVSDADAIGLAILGCWLIGYAWRLIGDAIEEK